MHEVEGIILVMSFFLLWGLRTNIKEFSKLGSWKNSCCLSFHVSHLFFIPPLRLFSCFLVCLGEVYVLWRLMYYTIFDVGCLMFSVGCAEIQVFLHVLFGGSVNN